METRAKRNHNPLNIEKNPRNNWKGLSIDQSDERFCRFREDIWGFRAAIIILKRYLAPRSLGGYGLDTISKIITRWAPPTENKTEAYIKFVEQKTQINKDLKIEIYSQFVRVVHAMALYESNYDYDTEVIWEALGLLQFQAICRDSYINKHAFV